MRLFCLEVKRILKSRRTLILLAVALFLAVIMAYLPISFESINRPGENGTVTDSKFMEKLHQRKSQMLYAHIRNMCRNMVRQTIFRWTFTRKILRLSGHFLTAYQKPLPIPIQA